MLTEVNKSKAQPPRCDDLMNSFAAIVSALDRTSLALAQASEVVAARVALAARLIERPRALSEILQRDETRAIAVRLLHLDPSLALPR